VSQTGNILKRIGSNAGDSQSVGGAWNGHIATRPSVSYDRERAIVGREIELSMDRRGGQRQTP